MTTPRVFGPRMFQAFLPLLVVVPLAAVLVSGCDTFPKSGTGDWSSVRPAKAPVAQKVSFAHPVQFAAGDGVLLEDQREGLDSFMTRVAPDTATPIRLQVHGGMVNAARKSVVAERLTARGYTVDVEPADPKQPSDVVRVVVKTYVVTLPGCPDWTENPAHTFANNPSANFGCATAQNLGLMIAEPADLAHGVEPGPADGAVQAAAIDRYRQGKTRALIGAGSTATPQAQQKAQKTGSN